MVNPANIMNEYSTGNLLVEAVYEYKNYYVPIFVFTDDIDIPILGLPLLIDKQTGETINSFPKGKYKIIVNPKREKYRTKLNQISFEKKMNHICFLVKKKKNRLLPI